MTTKWDNLQDLVTKFSDTICTYDGQPIRVVEVREDEHGYGFIGLLYNGDAAVVSLADPLFNYRDFNLGYANTNRAATWWCRRPLRQWQQGLRHPQMAHFTSFPGYLENNFGLSKPYFDMLMDNYPTFEECVGVTERLSTAFHRDFALTFEGRLEFRGNLVGGFTPDEGLQLHPKFTHLTETLQEALKVNGTKKSI